HNKAREEKGVKALQWDSILASDAESHAKTMLQGGQLSHAEGLESHGESLFMQIGDATFDQAVEKWLEEERFYNGEKAGEGDFLKWGHFSQCVWYSTTHIGMGRAQAENGTTFIVARYSPAGNVKGEKPF
ncbi:hypothetical protein M409DRAFT_36278, partial [Zasmidium cellare ATCC 36951]